MYLGCVMYADDLLLLSSSLNVLQWMVNICVTETDYWDIRSNVRKSIIARVGPRYKRECVSVTLNGVKLPFVNKARYLGVVITTSRRCKLGLSEPIGNFYKSVNGILPKCIGRMNEMVLLHLYNAYCKPFLLTYACECVSLKSEGDRLCSIKRNILDIIWGQWLQLFTRRTYVHRISASFSCLWHKKYTFLYKLLYSGNRVLVKLFSVFAKHGTNKLVLWYNVVGVINLSA